MPDEVKKSRCCIHIMRQFRESLLTQVTTEPDEETDLDFTYEAP
jgi:hypothetical protein